jgi:16S rRNA (adenine1518-N6/adenine1519-N6)-dimethyltransferase
MSLATPAKTIAILNKYNLHLTKSLGQNFLVDENILNKIGNLAELKSEDIVLEIGPGIGTLTQLLAKHVRAVIAVEYDKTFLPVLDETLSFFKNVKIFHSDALEFDLTTRLSKTMLPSKMVSNLPYNIASPLLINYLRDCPCLKTFVIMVQKEIALRMMAKPSTKSYSSFTLLLQYYCEPIFGFSVSRNVFIPIPNVDSAVVKLQRLKQPRIKVGNEALLFKLIKAAFSQRRKTISNSLAADTGFDKDKVELALEKCGINSKRRGETLSLEEFGALCRAFEKLRSTNIS